MPALDKVLITGATGFLGGHLCRRLLEMGVEVVATVRRQGPREAALAQAGAQVRLAPLDDPDALTRAAQGVEVVFHVAALASYLAPRARLEAVNLQGTRHVLAACRAAKVRRLVHCSSESVTLVNGDRIDEDESQPFPKRFLDHYSRTKALAEQEVLAASGPDLEATAVRPPWIWGEGDTSVFKATALAIRAGAYPWVGDATNRVTTCHVANVSAGLILAATAKAAPGRVYHVADEVRPTIRDFVGGLCAAGGLPLPQKRLPYWQAYLAAGVCDALRAAGIKTPLMASRPYVIHQGRTWTFNDRRARDELGYKPEVSMEQGFQRLAAWIHSRGGLGAALSL